MKAGTFLVSGEGRADAENIKVVTHIHVRCVTQAEGPVIMPINPRMQSRIPVQSRNWQMSPSSEYALGECPQCGAIGESQWESPLPGNDFVRQEWFECPSCGIEYVYQTTAAYRYSHIEAGTEEMRPASSQSEETCEHRWLWHEGSHGRPSYMECEKCGLVKLE